MESSLETRTCGEKDRKYSAIWSNTQKISDANAKTCMTHIKEICKMHDAEIENVQQQLGDINILQQYVDTMYVEMEVEIMRCMENKLEQ